MNGWLYLSDTWYRASATCPTCPLCSRAIQYRKGDLMTSPRFCASEVTTLWRYTNLFIIIITIIIFKPTSTKPQAEKLG